MDRDVSRRRLLKGAAAAGLGTTLSTGASAATPSGSRRRLEKADPPQYSYEDAITEYYHIPTRTGAEIWVDVIRPNTETPVPTIMVASPYYNTLGRGWRRELKDPHQGPEVPTSPGIPGLGAGESVPFPEWYDEYFVPRGYAVALLDLRGTRNSSGCQKYGDRDEIYDIVDSIDYLVEQDWSSGAVGMTGGSYDGTMAVGAAAEMPISGTHPEALKAIIPIRAIDRWYDYAFVNGTQIAAQSLVTPSLFTAALPAADTHNSGTDDTKYPLHVLERKACMGTFGAAVSAGHASPYQDANEQFWRERDFVKTAEMFNAATFIIHGLFDYNVKPHNAGYLWDALPDDLPKKLWWYNGKHGDPHTPESHDGDKITHPFQSKFVEATHRWFCQFLKDKNVGATAGHDVEIQRADGSWDREKEYPASTVDRTLYLAPDGHLREEAEEGSRAYADGASNAPETQTWVSDPFEQDTRISGQLGFEFDIVADGTDATVAVEVLSVPEGASPSDASTVKHTPKRDQPLLASYAWIRAWYRDTVPMRGRSTPHDGAPLTPGERTTLRFGSLHTDLVLPEGDRLALRVSNAAGGTLGSNQAGTVEVVTGPDGSRVHLPTTRRTL